MIELRNVSYTYMESGSQTTAALCNINIEIKEGEFIGIAGHTGSGKTTVAQILAGLLKPSEGSIVIDSEEITDYNEAARRLRKKVGIVFQYPEHQLFEETVYKDIAFAPRNKGLSDDEIDVIVKESARLVHLKEELFDKSPFELSGGQKRRVAIAGVLASKPSVLILDEPAAGLDPVGREKLLSELHRIRKEYGVTIVLISHSMEDLTQNADRIILLNDSKKYMDGSVKDIFRDYDLLTDCGLELPQITQVMKLLKEGGLDVDTDIFSVNDATDAVLRAMGVNV